MTFIFNSYNKEIKKCEDCINKCYMLEGFLMSCRLPKMSNEMKCTNEKMTWNTQDMNLSWYITKTNVDYTISGQWMVISTLDHLATTPRVFMKDGWFSWMLPYKLCICGHCTLRIHFIGYHDCASIIFYLIMNLCLINH